MKQREIKDAKIGLFIGGIIGFLIVKSIYDLLVRAAIYLAKHPMEN